MLFGTGLFFHAFLYNFYLEALGHSEAVMGHAAAALAAGGLAVLLPAGWITDRLGSRVALIVAALATTAGLILGAVAQRVPAIYGAAVVAGLGGGIWRVAVPPALMRLAHASARPRAFAWNVGLLVATGGLGMAVAGSVPDWLGSWLSVERLLAIRVALLLGAIGSGAAILLFAGLPQRRLAHDESASAGDRSATRVRLGRALLPVLLFVLVWMLGPALVAPFLNIFFTRRLEVSVGLVGVIFAVAHLVWGVCVMGSGEVATRVGTRYLLIATLAVFAPAVWGLSVASSLGAAVGLFILQGAVSPITNPLIDQLLLERVPPERYGVVSSWRNVAADVSAIIGASAGGQILAASSFGPLLVWAGVVGLVGAVGLTAALRLTPVASISSAP